MQVRPFPFSVGPIFALIFWGVVASGILPEVIAWRGKRSTDSSKARDRGSLNLIAVLWWSGIAMDFSFSLLLPQAAISWNRTLFFFVGICLMLLGIALRWYSAAILGKYFTFVGASRASRRLAPEPEPIIVNDIHSRLNSTRVSGISHPRSLEDLQRIVRTARKDRNVISVAGGRHAMGGQQFGTDTLLIDIRKLSRVLNLDRKSGIIEVEAGIEWPELINGYLTLQIGDGQPWVIAQKQTGADRFTLAGTIAANAHGRGLKMKPFISDVESFILVDATGTARRCSRTENPELFRLVHGGYGLFGVVTSVQLRLAPRTKRERVVDIRTVDDLIGAFENRISDGFLYGDFQFSIEPDSEDFLHKGVFSCYRPVSMETPIPPTEKQLTDDNWRQLLFLAHTNEKRAFG